MDKLLKHHVYILQLSNDHYYVGRTDNLEKRINAHKSGHERTTKRFLPLKLVTYLAFSKKNKAIKFEKYLKTDSGFAFHNKRLI